MDSYELNKMLMAVGFTVLGVFAVNEIGNALYHVRAPERAGYVVEGVEVAATHGPTTTQPTTTEAETAPDFGTLLSAADLSAGENVAKQCVQCHTWDKGGTNKIGPNLYGVVGGPMAHHPAFNYSTAMKNKGGTWGYAELYEYLRRPAAFVPGTKMSFAGLRRPEDRINVIALMRTWADAPHPIPPAQATATPASHTEPVTTPVPATGETPVPGIPGEGTPPQSTVPTTPEGTPPASETPPAEPETHPPAQP